KMRYFKFPKWSRSVYPGAIWDFSFREDHAVYLTFDDGPAPGVTEWILDLLDDYNAKATFFCLGEKVETSPELYAQILKSGHVTGNHGMQHLNGLKTGNKDYLHNVLVAKKLINSTLFRPAYGKLKTSQYKMLREAGFDVVFWSAMAYDFDETLSSRKRIAKMKSLTENGAIFVF